MGMGDFLVESQSLCFFYLIIRKEVLAPHNILIPTKGVLYSRFTFVQLNQCVLFVRFLL